MATFNLSNHSAQKELTRRLLHFDHLKTIANVYQLMRDDQTIARMKSPDFSNDHSAEKKLDEAFFTSLVIRLQQPALNPLFDQIAVIYQKVKELILHYHPDTKVEAYFDTAHITVKSFSRNMELNWDEMHTIADLIRPTIKNWLDKMGPETRLFAKGLFCHLHPQKGLSLGIRFFPSTTLVQEIRGECGLIAYEANDQGTFKRDILNPETNFHTLLTHSTGLRARGFQLPFHPKFVEKFETLISGYDEMIFGYLTDLSLEDFFLGNCQSDRYIITEEVGKEIAMGD